MVTIRQRILKIVYPLWMGLTRLIGKNRGVMINEGSVEPRNSLYDLSVQLINGEEMKLFEFKGNKILFVNTASDCGYTDQYEELKKLNEQTGNKLKIIAFPANDFKAQEKGSDKDIELFCKMQYGINFPMAKKSVVIKNANQNKVYQWLTDKTKNGWNNQQPRWNFSKYLVNENGLLTHYFDASISPLSDEVIRAVNEKK
jgi:glutathione peroxidase